MDTTPDAEGLVGPKTASAAFAHLADIWYGRTTASLHLRRTLFVRFALDWEDRRIATRKAVTDRAVRYRLELGVGKLAAHRSGTDYIHSYDELEITM
ncbi:hypothetical protein ACFWMU_25065 [Streptomyces sp. NPDC058357]|uniref:hypothetical protein n=1 Tax=unclassified Streptomyces TaxID=2593676 RepID=UPI00364718CB